MRYKLITLGHPGLYMIEGFLTSKECASLIKAAKKLGLKKNLIFNGVPQLRDSVTTARFERNENELIADVRKRISKITKIPVAHGESFEIARHVPFETSKHYPHNDFDPQVSKTARVAQVLIYLNDVKEGGETEFPARGLKITPRKGVALLWYGVANMEPPKKGDEKFRMPKRVNSDPYAFHFPRPCKKGEKWVIYQFLHASPCPQEYNPYGW